MPSKVEPGHAALELDCHARGKQRRGLGLAMIVLTVALYGPYVLQGGFVCDDWAVWSRAYEYPGFWATYRSWFPLFSNRPLAPMLLAATGNLFGDWVTGYLLASLTFYGMAIGLTATVLRHRAGESAALVFVLLALCPSISSTLVFSPGMQILGTSTLFLWALSLFLLDRYMAGRNGWGTLLASHGAILVALLIYEVFLPLLLLHLAYPLLFRPAESRRTAIDDLIRHLGPLVMILFLIVVLQKLVMPALMPVHSRLSNTALVPAIRSLAYWAFALVAQAPVLLADGLRRMDLPTAAVVAIALGTLGFGLRQETNTTGHRADDDQLRRLILVAVASLGATAILYVLSGSDAAVYGYDNRVLASAWWALALLAGLLTRLLHPRLGFRLVLAALIALNTCSFVLQRNNYLASQWLQQQIVETLVRLTERRAVPPDATVLAHVPAVLPHNYNDECVFARPWDLVNAIRYYRPDQVRDVAPVSPTLVRKGRVVVDAEGVAVNGLWRGELARLWFFTFDEGGSSTLTPVRDADHLRYLLSAVGRAPSPPASAAARLTEQAATAAEAFLEGGEGR